MKKILGLTLIGFLAISFLIQKIIFKQSGIEQSKSEVLSDRVLEGDDLGSAHVNISFYDPDGKKVSKAMNPPGTPIKEQFNEASVINAISVSNAEPLKVEWSVLMAIEFHLEYVPDLEISMYRPDFTEEVKALDGKEVIVEGYVIPISEDGNHIALSANPYASCFFCGKGSPASIIGVYVEKIGERLNVDDVKSFRGTLKLNYNDPDEFYYIMENAKLE